MCVDDVFACSVAPFNSMKERDPNGVNDNPGKSKSQPTQPT